MNAIVERMEPNERRVVATPLDLLNNAVERGATPEILTKLMDLHERFERTQARKAFDNAMADAKAEIPVITKNRKVDFTSGKGRTNYAYEDLGEIARTVNPFLAKHGLSYRFRTSSTPSEPVTVTCVVSHRDGYSEENTLCAGRDDSGNKNSIQAIGSTLTYLQRMTLKAALGIAASHDDDGKGGDSENIITDEQAEQIRTLITDTKSDLTKFLAYMKAESISDILAKDYERAVGLLETKKAKS